MPQPGGRPLGGRLTGSREERGKRPRRGGQHFLSLQCPYPWRRRLHTLRRGHPTQVTGRHPDEGPRCQPLNTTVILPARAAMGLPKAGVPGRFQGRALRVQWSPNSSLGNPITLAGVLQSSTPILSCLLDYWFSLNVVIIKPTRARYLPKCNTLEDRPLTLAAPEFVWTSE